jgi:hypothetical protein
MAAGELSIGPIADGEEEAAIALWHACGLTRPWNDPRRDLDFARGKVASEVLVGRIGSEIVGSAMVGHDGHRGTVYYLAIARERRGSGIGRAMMRAAEGWLVERGVWKVNLLVRTGNEQVLGFYAALGYEEQATTCLGRWIDPAKKGA